MNSSLCKPVICGTKFSHSIEKRTHNNKSIDATKTQLSIERRLSTLVKEQQQNKHVNKEKTVESCKRKRINLII